MSVAAQVLQQAEALKVTVADGWSGTNEAWASRQNLQDLYQRLLVMDLEYALDKKVEQDLWNHAFKNQINSLQVQAKEKQNPKRNEIQASLNLFLETASGFYHQLLQELCSAFQLDLPFRLPGSSFGILKEYKSNNSKLRNPKKSSCLYVCQHCLVHLGDIARYRQQTDQAQSYYRHAASLVPYNGQPYNQLAILEAAKGNKLATVFYYIRSIAVKHPFPAATTNLEKFYSKVIKDAPEYKGKLSVSEMILAYLQFHALIHSTSDLEKARKLEERLTLAFATHVTSGALQSSVLCYMFAINLFAMHHASRKLVPAIEDEKESPKERRKSLSKSGSKESLKGRKDKDGSREKSKSPTPEALSQDEEASYELVLNYTVAMFDHLLHLIPKQEQKAKESQTLAAIKLMLDWISSERDILKKPVFTTHMIWPNMSKLLNNLQYQKDTAPELEKFVDTPLPEDVDLQHFVPLQKAYSDLDYLKINPENMDSELETKLRCRRIVNYGIWISDNFPMSCFLKYQKNKLGKIQFTAPGGLQIKASLAQENAKAAEGKMNVSSPGAMNIKGISGKMEPKILKAAAATGQSLDMRKGSPPGSKPIPSAVLQRHSPASSSGSPGTAQVSPGARSSPGSGHAMPAVDKPPIILQKPGPGAAQVPGVLPVNPALGVAGVVPFDPSVPPPMPTARMTGPPPADQPFSGPPPPFNIRGPPPGPPPPGAAPFKAPLAGGNRGPYPGMGMPNVPPPLNLMAGPPPGVGGPPPRADGIRVPYTESKPYGFNLAQSPPQAGSLGPPPPIPHPGGVLMEDPTSPSIYSPLPPGVPAGAPRLNPPLLADTRRPPPLATTGLTPPMGNSGLSPPLHQPGNMASPLTSPNMKQYQQHPLASTMLPPDHGNNFLPNDFNHKPAVDLSSLSIKAQMESNSLQFRSFDFPQPSNDFGFEEGVPKPDSPPTARRSTSDYGGFTGLSNGLHEEGGNNTYQLFSESPWSMNINNKPKDPQAWKHSKPLSPYALSERNPPAAEFQDPAIVAAGMPTSPRVIGGMDGGDMTWGAGAYPNARPPEEKPGFAATLQSIWTSGPSPLEKLLEQQKMQRNTEPH